MANIGYATMSMIPTLKGAQSLLQREVDELLRKIRPEIAMRADTSKFTAEARSAVGEIDGQTATINGDASPFVAEAKAGGSEGGSMLATGVAAASAATVLAFAAVGAAGAVAFVKAFSAGVEQDNLDGIIGARLGLTADQAAAAGDAAGRAYTKGFGDSQASAGDALTAARFNFGNVWDPAELERISEKALGIADIFGGDVVESTRAASNLVKNGLASNAEEAFDLITKGYQSGLDISGDFLDTINEYSVQWSKVGLTGPEALGQLSRGLQAGARDTDKLADAQKEFAIRAIDGSVSTTKAYADLGLSAWDLSRAIAGGGDGAKQATSTIIQNLSKMQDEIKRDEVGVALFGTQWEDIGPAVIAGLDPALGGLENFAGATDAALEQAGGGFGNMVERWKRSAEVGLGDFAQEHITPAFERIGTAFEQGGLAAAIGQFGAESGVIRDKVVAWFNETLPAVRAWISANGPAIAAKAQEIGKAVVEWAADARGVVLERLGEWLPAIGEWVQNTAVPFIEAHWGEWVDAFVGWIGPIAGTFVEQMGGFLVKVGGWFVTDFIPWAQAKGAEWGLALLKWFATTAVPWGLEKLGELQAAIGAWITDTAVPWLFEKGKELGAAILQWIIDLPDLVRQNAPGAFDALVSAAKAAFKAIIMAWNELSLDVEVPGFVPGIGGQKYDVLPNVPVPEFHQGGVVPGSGEMLALLEGGEGVFTKEQMAGMGPSFHYDLNGLPPMEALAMSNRLAEHELSLLAG